MPKIGALSITLIVIFYPAILFCDAINVNDTHAMILSGIPLSFIIITFKQSIKYLHI